MNKIFLIDSHEFRFSRFGMNLYLIGWNKVAIYYINIIIISISISISVDGAKRIYYNYTYIILICISFVLYWI